MSQKQNGTSVRWNGVKVFAATMAQEREKLGDKVTAWIRQYPQNEIVDTVVTQSSDEAFHCIAITVFYFEKGREGLACSEAACRPSGLPGQLANWQFTGAARAPDLHGRVRSAPVALFSMQRSSRSRRFLKPTSAVGHDLAPGCPRGAFPPCFPDGDDAAEPAPAKNRS